EVERLEPLRVLEPTLLAELAGPLADPVEGVPGPLRLMRAQGLELDLERLRDIHVRVGILGGEPQVRHLEGLEALVDQLWELRAARRVGHDGAQRERPRLLV